MKRSVVIDCFPDPDGAMPGVVAKARKPAGWEIPAEASLLAPEREELHTVSQLLRGHP